MFLCCLYLFNSLFQCDNLCQILTSTFQKRSPAAWKICCWFLLSLASSLVSQYSSLSPVHAIWVLCSNKRVQFCCFLLILPSLGCFRAFFCLFLHKMRHLLRRISNLLNDSDINFILEVQLKSTCLPLLNTSYIPSNEGPLLMLLQHPILCINEHS